MQYHLSESFANGATCENMKNRGVGRKGAEYFIKTIAQATGKMAGFLRNSLDESDYLL
jgi:hypothetical protein